MSLLERIRSENLEARKAGDRLKSSLLTTLISEAQAVGKNAKPPRETTDEEVVSLIKKFIKNSEFVSQKALEGIALNKMDVIQSASNEIKILEEFLPKQLTGEETKIIVEGLKAQGVAMKDIMIHFKENYAGRYDGGTVALYAR